MIKTLKKKEEKGGIFFSRTHVGATWHARPRGRAMLAHVSACVARR